jgi:hypothetical protein
VNSTLYVESAVVASWPVRRILSGRLLARSGHPSRPAVTRRLQRSTRGSEDGPSSPCSTLLPMGFTEPPGSPRVLVRSYRTVSPLPVPGEPGHRRSALCCTVLRVAPTGCYPASCPVESGRSSDRCCTAARHAAAWPTRYHRTDYDAAPVRDAVDRRWTREPIQPPSMPRPAAITTCPKIWPSRSTGA